jgi:hypothetical protein
MLRFRVDPASSSLHGIGGAPASKCPISGGTLQVRQVVKPSAQPGGQHPVNDAALQASSGPAA